MDLERAKLGGMLGYLALVAVLTALGVVSWKLCLTAQPCVTRPAGRRRAFQASKVPLGVPREDNREGAAAPGSRAPKPRVRAGASTLLSRRHDNGPVPPCEVAPLSPPVQEGLRVSTSDGLTLHRPVPVLGRSPQSPWHGAGGVHRGPRSPRSPIRSSPKREPSLAFRQPLPPLHQHPSDWRTGTGAAGTPEGLGERVPPDGTYTPHANQRLAHALPMQTQAQHGSMHQAVFTPMPDLAARGAMQSALTPAARTDPGTNAAESTPWASTTLNTDRLFNPQHAHERLPNLMPDDKENDTPPHAAAHHTLADQALSSVLPHAPSILKRQHATAGEAGAGVVADGARPSKRPSHGGFLLYALEAKYVCLCRTHTHTHTHTLARTHRYRKLDVAGGKEKEQQRQLRAKPT